MGGVGKEGGRKERKKQKRKEVESEWVRKRKSERE